MREKEVPLPKSLDRLDLERHARLEVGLLDGDLPSTSHSVTLARNGPKTPSLWQALKKLFH